MAIYHPLVLFLGTLYLDRRESNFIITISNSSPNTLSSIPFLTPTLKSNYNLLGVRSQIYGARRRERDTYYILKKSINLLDKYKYIYILAQVILIKMSYY
jgi:hypothetical protein